MVKHYRIKREHYKINEPEVLNQVIGSVRFLNCKFRGIDKRRGGAV